MWWLYDRHIVSFSKRQLLLIVLFLPSFSCQPRWTLNRDTVSTWDQTAPCSMGLWCITAGVASLSSILSMPSIMTFSLPPQKPTHFYMLPKGAVPTRSQWGKPQKTSHTIPRQSVRWNFLKQWDSRKYYQVVMNVYSMDVHWKDTSNIPIYTYINL